ncbi:MAG: prephenate dehydrogenase [Synergistaceae bacterium]|jgi:prephenate dehydrogenase|nr:prephenate dehydrogenase [Synergistaceae bacterium]
MSYRIGIIGLGLMGASLAGALHGFKNARIAGADVSEGVCVKAKQAGFVDEAYVDAGDAIHGADLIIFCVYARHIPRLISENALCFKTGSVVSDICGVKSELYAKLRGLLPEHVDYVGIHPMTGKERDGIDNADPAIYKNSGMIICPLPSSKPEDIALMKDIAEYIGVTRLATSPPGEHDSVIAYTSDLMHIAAAGLCVEFHAGMTSAFAAGAFRDCTRIANINPEAWTELLMDNRSHTLARLNEYIGSLQTIRRSLADGDKTLLYSLLDKAGRNKRKMLAR